MKKKIKHTLNYPAMEKYMKIARKWGEKRNNEPINLLNLPADFPAGKFHWEIQYLYLAVRMCASARLPERLKSRHN